MAGRIDQPFFYLQEKPSGGNPGIHDVRDHSRRGGNDHGAGRGDASLDYRR